jgi:hypothetical protein
MSLPNYPDALPPEAWQMAAGLVRGQLPPVAPGVHAGWAVMGYVAGMALPDPAPAAQIPLAKTPRVSLTREQVAVHLEKMATHSGGHAAARALNLPWGQILAVLTQALQTWLASQAGA